ncbi:MAG: type II toxin-antitoxin system RelE/ParE family toxin [Mycobacteriales bacterium]
MVGWELVIHPQVREWLHDWREDRRSAQQIAAAITYVLDNGPQAGRPMVDTISGSQLKNLKELRPGSSGRSELRLLMVFDEGTQVVLLVAGDKAGNWTKWYR